MPKQIITIIGNIGSGKSTALPLIANHFKAHTIQADNLFQTTDPFAQDYLEDMTRWAFTNELWLTIQRVKLIQDEMKANKKNTYVIDSGLLMSWVYTFSHFNSGRLSQAEWDFYCELYEAHSNEILSNSAVVFLDYSVPTLLKRIMMRGRDYELEFYTEAYLNDLQLGLKALVKNLNKKNIEVISISEEQVGDFELNVEDAKAMFQIIEKSSANMYAAV